ncbi:TetR-like C-terminal domain-containing protein [Spirillospora sp. CA-294931]|uniref:TetR-like C-terminal domain-containing protein n=1 Tax=Spirillospora sp. CA-294931 TaxID=3240042 RepID=UPI003D949D23
MRSRAAALAAARELLVERGLPGVTHVTVAERSGVGRTTLYRHWPDAAAMLQDAITEVSIAARPEPTGELRTDLLNLLEHGRNLLHQPASERAMRAFIERSGVDPTFSRVKETMYDTGIAGMRGLLEAAKARGDLPRDLNVDSAADQLIGPLFFRRLLGNREITSDFVHDIVDAFLKRQAPNA